MAHEIWRDATGKDHMFMVGKREDAWHHLGQRTTNAATWEQAMELAGLDWKVSKERNRIFVTRDGQMKLVETDSFTVVRDIDNAQLGTVGADYEVLQNSQAFQFVDTLLEANGGSHYDSAGALGNGERIWCAVRVPKADFTVIGDDKHETYLVFATGHDGSLAHTVMLTDTRVVCQNTLNMALNGAETFFKVRHTKTADARLDKAKQLMTNVITDADILRQKLQALARRKMTKETMAEVLNRLFPQSKEENAKTIRRENVITEVLGLYANNDGGVIPEVAGSAYNLLNAVTEYTDHFRTARLTKGRAGMTVERARAENAVIGGTGNKLKNQALGVITDVMEDVDETQIDSDIDANPMNDSDFLKAIGIKL